MSTISRIRDPSSLGSPKAALLAVIGLVLVLFPLLITSGVLTGYPLHILEVILVWCLLTTALNLLVGYTGPESFAHGGLFGIGGYVTAILTMQFAVPLFGSILLGAVAAVVAALFIALPSLRLKGVYFAILTIAFQVIYEDSVLILNEFTGGLNGLSGIPTFAGFGLQPRIVDYYTVLIAVLISLYLLYRIIHSSLGDTFMMIRQDEDFAEHLGYSTTRYKILSFAISAFFTGLAGGLFAQHNSFIGPTLSSIFISFQIFVFVIVGGAGYFWGPIAAAAILMAIQQVFSVAAAFSRLFMAVLLLVVIVTIPGGIASIDYLSLAQRVTGTEEND